jgi:hypothetical protein
MDNSPNFNSIFNVPDNTPVEINNKITFVLHSIHILEKYEDRNGIRYLLQPIDDEIIKKDDTVILTIMSKNMKINGKNRSMNIDFKELFGNDFDLIDKTQDDIKNYMESHSSNDDGEFTIDYKIKGTYIPISNTNFISIRPSFFQDKIGKIYIFQKNKNSKYAKVQDDYFDNFVNCEINNCQLEIASKLKGGKNKTKQKQKRPRRKTRKTPPKK